MVGYREVYDHSSLMTAPRSVKAFCSFSASSLFRFALSVCGSDSTNFLACEVDVSQVHRMEGHEDSPR